MARKFLLEGLLFVVMLVFAIIQPLSLFSLVTLGMAYLFVVLFVNTPLLYGGLLRGFQDMRIHYLYTCLLAIILLLSALWGFAIESVFFMVALFAFISYSWDSRILAFGALVTLSLCPILLIAKQDMYAEQIAIYAYYFLILTVIVQLVEIKRHSDKHVESQHKTK